MRGKPSNFPKVTTKPARKLAKRSNSPFVKFQLDRSVNVDSRVIQFTGIMSLGESIDLNHGEGATTKASVVLLRNAPHQLKVELEMT